MGFLLTHIEDDLATLMVDRPKVNAINEPLTEELLACFRDLAGNHHVKAVIITGQGKFFSFGLDIPEFLTYSKKSFLRFTAKFAMLYTEIFLHPKPVIAALNGHAIAGGCMLATACDSRIMVAGRARISLNEINFGSSLFPGSVEMLKYWVGNKNAETVAFSGAMYSAEEAKAIGLVDQVVPQEALADHALMAARQFALRYGPAFESIKGLLRREVGDLMKRKDELYRPEMVDIWYSENTWEQLQNIKIHG
ncbi:MAG: enoyl-CoA hydratase/isomerase family protein [Desulfomonile tiedjei]|nr:enoyl-CoA hydratase/isomerase family protein [Desulfomonile tiedjei]